MCEKDDKYPNVAKGVLVVKEEEELQERVKAELNIADPKEPESNKSEE
jgi:hypothetical protein